MIPVCDGRLPTAERRITRFHEAMHLKRIDLVGRGIMRRPTAVSHGRAGGARRLRAGRPEPACRGTWHVVARVMSTEEERLVHGSTPPSFRTGGLLTTERGGSSLVTPGPGVSLAPCRRCVTACFPVTKPGGCSLLTGCGGRYLPSGRFWSLVGGIQWWRSDGVASFAWSAVSNIVEGAVKFLSM